MSEKVSIIMPVLNETVDGVNYAWETANSILANTDHGNYEILAVDDSCTDGSCDALQQFDRRVKVVRNEVGPLGVGPSRNLGAAYSDAPWLLFVDAHEKFDREMRRLHKDGSVKEDFGTQDFLVDMCRHAAELEAQGLELFILSVGGLSYWPDGKAKGYGCKWKYSERCKLPHGVWTSNRADEAPYRARIDALMGATYLMRRETLDTIGGWLEAPGRGYNDDYLSTAATLCGIPLFCATDVHSRHLYDKKVGGYRHALNQDIRQRWRLASHVLYDELRPTIQEKAFGADGVTTEREMLQRFGQEWCTQRAILQRNRVLSDQQVLEKMGLLGEYLDWERGDGRDTQEELSIQERYALLSRAMMGNDIKGAASVALGHNGRDFQGMFAQRLKDPADGEHFPLEVAFLMGLQMVQLLSNFGATCAKMEELQKQEKEG